MARSLNLLKPGRKSDFVARRHAATLSLGTRASLSRLDRRPGPAPLTEVMACCRWLPATVAAGGGANAGQKSPARGDSNPRRRVAQRWAWGAWGHLASACLSLPQPSPHLPPRPSRGPPSCECICYNHIPRNYAAGPARPDRSAARNCFGHARRAARRGRVACPVPTLMRYVVVMPVPQAPSRLVFQSGYGTRRGESV